MDCEKYIGLDVHQATIVVAVMDSAGKLVMESILETEAGTILQFFAGWRGTLSVTFEEGTCSAWLYDLLNPHVDKLVVCNPRKNALLKDPVYEALLLQDGVTLPHGRPVTPDSSAPELPGEVPP